MKNPKIRFVSQRVGRAELGDDTFGTHYSEFDIDLQPLQGEEAELVQAEIRQTLAKFPGAYFALKPFLTERIEETIAGVTAQVAIKIFGDDLDLQQFGFQPVKVLEAVQTAYQGTVVAQTYQGNRVFDVVVILDAATRSDPESVGSL